MASVIYNSAKKELMDGTLDLDTNTLKVMLVTSAYTPDIDAHTKRSDVTNEVVGTGYTAGGMALANKAVTVDTVDDEGVFDADDLTWSASTITARAAVIYKDTGLASTDNLIAYVDFGSDQSSSSADFTIQWGAEGIINLN